MLKKVGAICCSEKVGTMKMESKNRDDNIHGSK